MRTVQQYLKTLRRVPDDVILSVASRDIQLATGRACLCGWVVRESLAKLRGVDAAEIRNVEADETSGRRCADLYGGTSDEWTQIYVGVTDTPDRKDWFTGAPLLNRLPLIEAAFTLRVEEAVAEATST